MTRGRFVNRPYVLICRKLWRYDGYFIGDYMYKYILFDLDGTLTDPALGITNSIMYAQKKMGLEVWDRERLLFFIGPPLKEAFMEQFSISEEDAIKTVAHYRDYFPRKGIYENRVYDGIKEMLSRLKKDGKVLALATSKPQEFAEIVLNHFDLAKYFDVVVGATMDGKLGKKSDVITVALQKCVVNDLSQAVMIGDRHHDIDGANENKLDSIGVLYGYGNYEELKNSGATYIAKTPDEILEIIIKN